MTKPRKPNVIQKRQLRAYINGQASAVRATHAQLERRYQVRMTARVWVAVYCVFGLGLALGCALGVAWVRSGAQGF